MSSTANRFGIIRTLPSGVPQWVDDIEGLAEAKAYLMRLAVRQPGEFYIYAEPTGVIVERFVCVGLEQELEAVSDTEVSTQNSSYLN